ncbi:MAG: hypothetical protein RML12_00115 [Xanthomonadales bacterium]|nr:hypothetical protein [Xanthomonadales bacterium]
MLALLAGIRCPVALALAAPPSAVIAAAALERRLAAIPRARILRLAGGHHLHMERPAELAAFFAETLATLG